jgi:hypothetical protein
MKGKESLSINFRKLFVSPYGATIFPMILLLISFSFPPKIYEYYVKEPNYMFLNFNMLGFGLLCILFYYIGLFLSNYKPLFNMNLFKRKIYLSAYIYIGLILLLTIVSLILFVYLFIVYFTNVTNLIYIDIIAGSGDLIKFYAKELKIPFGLGALPIFLEGFEFWLLYKLYSMKPNLSDIGESKKYNYLKDSIILSFVLFVIISIFTLSRPSLVILILGWFIIYLHFNKKLRPSNLLKLSLAIIIIFVITSILRWASSSENLTDLILERLLGYTVAAFNRFALIIEGNLSYVSAGVSRIFYILPILKIPLTNIKFFDLRETSLLALSAVGNAGLNSSYNMATLFGGVYQSIGLATPIYFTILGFIGGRLYNSFKREKTFGIIMYPLFYSSVVLWIVDVNFFLMHFLYFFYSFLVLSFYNAFFKPVVRL